MVTCGLVRRGVRGAGRRGAAVGARRAAVASSCMTRGMAASEHGIASTAAGGKGQLGCTCLGGLAAGWKGGRASPWCRR